MILTREMAVLDLYDSGIISEETSRDITPDNSLHEITSALNLPRLEQLAENALAAIEAAADHIRLKHG